MPFNGTCENAASGRIETGFARQPFFPEPMSVLVVVLMLASAVIHAGWSTAAKAAEERVGFLVAFYATIGAGSAAAIPWTGLLSPDEFVYVAITIVPHAIYNLSTIAMYRHGDMSVVYGISRGMAPLLVTLFSFALIGEWPGGPVLIGILIISAGLFLLADARALQRKSALAWACLTGLSVATYSTLGGWSTRQIGDPFAFAAHLLALNGLTMLATGFALRGAALPGRLWAALPRALPGGILGGFGYWVALWAMSVAPLGGVSALRETSVVFAALFAKLFLGEVLGARRILAALAVAAGIVLMAV